MDDVPATTGCCEVVVTAARADELAALTRTLVEERLAACGQITAPIRSVYRWQGTRCPASSRSRCSVWTPPIWNGSAWRRATLDGRLL